MAIDYYFGAVKKGYAKFDPNALYSICQNDELGRLCCLVYFDLLMHLNRKDGKCFPTADRIAWELGYKAEDENGKIRHAEVSKAISKLEQLGWIKIEGGGYKGSARQYSFPIAKKYGVDGELGNCYTGDMYNEEAPKEQSLVQKFVQLEDRREMSAIISEITKGLAPVEAAPVIDDFLKATFSEYMNTNKTEEQIKETLRQCGLYHHIHIFDDFDQIKKDSIGT